MTLPDDLPGGEWPRPHLELFVNERASGHGSVCDFVYESDPARQARPPTATSARASMALVLIADRSVRSGRPRASRSRWRLKPG